MIGKDGAMKYILSTPPTVAAGSLVAAGHPQLAAEGGLSLRPWDDDDAPAFFGAYQDPAIRHWHTLQPASVAQVREWFSGYRRDWELEKAAHWAVTGDGGEVLGRIAMRGFNFDDGIAVCAYWVLPAARGAGVASRALAAVSEWALGPAGFYRLTLDHSVHNQASCRVATKAGFALEGTKRSAAVHADGRHDMHSHARVRDLAAFSAERQ
jgi:RimJ/RimL family protein N-acetyltransferase